MNVPSPALVTQRAVQRLPRAVLLAFCAAWIVPGMVGRDPWRNEDLSAFGLMTAMAEGRTGWLSPTLGGLTVPVEPLPHWIGALAIMLLGPWMDPALAARLPFALLLGLTLACTWYATYHLARTDAAQPVAFAFGGEAEPVAYARAVADGSVLALIATLGLLQLGHETTPELMQLFGMSLSLWALAAAPFRGTRARLGIAAGLVILAASGAPTVAALVGFSGTVICWRSTYPPARAFVRWVVVALLLAVVVASGLRSWDWRLAFEPGGAQVVQIARQWAWFMWPSSLFALWTVWRWRRHWRHRHVSIPGAIVLTGLVSNVWMGGHDRALMLALPALAVLAAFALPTMKRGFTALIDWFSVFFFTPVAALVWLTYVAMWTGQPATWAANIVKLQPGFEPRFSAVALVLAVVASLAWIALVRWRTSRARHALWKSLVLPASGVALCWLLLMTLCLPLLDYARSARPLIERGRPFLADSRCVAAPDATISLVAGLEVHGRVRVEAGARGAPQTTRCDTLVSFSRVAAAVPLAGWRLVAAERRNRESSELMAIYRRIADEPEDIVRP